MRLNELLTECTLLLEYDAEKTWQAYGPGILAVLQRDATTGRLRDLAKTDPEHVKGIVLKMLDNIDPTPNKAYSQWLARLFSNGSVKLEDLMSRGADALNRYNELKVKNKLQPEDKDINRIKTFTNFEDVVDKYADVDLSVNRKDKREAQAEEDRGSSEVVFEDDAVKIIKPKDLKSAMYYGRGTRWCTASKNNNMYEEYQKKGDLYIIVPKAPSYDGEKYQFHFSTRSFMDEKDTRVSLGEMLDKYPSVRKGLQQFAPTDAHFIPDDKQRSAGMVAQKAELTKFGYDHSGVWVFRLTNMAYNQEVTNRFGEVLSTVGIHIDTQTGIDGLDALVVDMTKKANLWVHYSTERDDEAVVITDDGFQEYTDENPYRDMSEMLTHIFPADHMQVGVKLLKSLLNNRSRSSLDETLTRMTKVPAYKLPAQL